MRSYLYSLIRETCFNLRARHCGIAPDGTRVLKDDKSGPASASKMSETEDEAVPTHEPAQDTT